MQLPPLDAGWAGSPSTPAWTLDIALQGLLGLLDATASTPPPGGPRRTGTR